jgi:hypothetical protein
MFIHQRTQMRTWLKEYKKMGGQYKANGGIMEKSLKQYPRATKVCLSYLKMYAMKWVL